MTEVVDLIKEDRKHLTEECGKSCEEVEKLMQSIEIEDSDGELIKMLAAARQAIRIKNKNGTC